MSWIKNKLIITFMIKGNITHQSSETKHHIWSFKRKRKGFIIYFKFKNHFQLIFHYRKVRARVRQRRENPRQLLEYQFNYWQSQLTDTGLELSQAVCITPRMTTLTTWQSSAPRLSILFILPAPREHSVPPCGFCPIHFLKLVTKVRHWRRKDSLSVISPPGTLSRLGSWALVKTTLLSPVLTASARLEWWWPRGGRRTGGQ